MIQTEMSNQYKKQCHFIWAKILTIYVKWVTLLPDINS